MGNTPNKITKKFREQVNSLIEEGVVANQQEVVDAIKWNKSQMSEAMKGTKNISLAVYRKFTDRYGLPNSEVREPEALYLTNPKDEKIIEILESQVRDKDERIQYLLVQINSLKEELRDVALANQAVGMTNQRLLSELVSQQRKQDLKKVAFEISKENLSHFEAAKQRGNLIGGGK